MRRDGVLQRIKPWSGVRWAPDLAVENLEPGQIGSHKQLEASFVLLLKLRLKSKLTSHSDTKTCVYVCE